MSEPSNYFQDPVLIGKHLRLEPLQTIHGASLAKHGDSDCFRYFMTVHPPTYDEEGFVAYINAVVSRSATVSFAVVTFATGEAVGSTAFLDVRPHDRHVEIGMTWIGAKFRGTLVNPEMKLLMLTHAFETLGCARVTLKTDGRNLLSQAAIAKLGAVREGTLRKWGMMPDGFIRDTVMYSILESEWPDVRAKLEQRLSTS